MTDTQRIVPAPIRKELRVKASRERAFEVFATKMGSWWIKGHSVVAQIHSTEQADVVIEPRIGGRWYEVGANGAEYDWGRVLAWEPPARLVLAWQLTGEFMFDPELETVVEVTFSPDGEFTLVHLEHRELERFGENAVAIGSGLDEGWDEMLGAFSLAVGT